MAQITIVGDGLVKDCGRNVLGRCYDLSNGRYQKIQVASLKSVKPHYIENESKSGFTEDVNVFLSSDDYNISAAEKFGVEYQPGMLSSARWTPLDPAGSPYLCPAEKFDNSIHLYYECYVSKCVATLTLDSRSSSSAARKLLETCGKQTPGELHNFYHNVGSHFVWRLTYGYKAELYWEVSNVKNKSPAYVDGVKSDFMKAIQNWKDAGFQKAPATVPMKYTKKSDSRILSVARPRSQSETAKDERKPLEPEAHQRWGTTQNFAAIYNSIKQGNINDALVRDSLVVIRIELEPLTSMFPQGKDKKTLEQAVSSYYLRRSPLKQKSLSDNMLISIYSADNDRWVRVNQAGNLYADVALSSSLGDYDLYQLPDECLFTITNNPAFNRFALYSVKYNKLVSRGNTKQRFRFRYLPINIIGSHESFTLNGDFLMHFGTWHGPRFIHLSKSEQMFPGAGREKKSRFWLRPVLKPSIEESKPKPMKEPDAVPKEPILSPGDAIRVAEAAAIEAKKKDTKEYPKFPAKKERFMQVRGETRTKHKFNSTSSLYIRDTIQHPDTDELLQRLAQAVLLHIVQGHKVPSDKRVEIDIFDELKHPIYRNTREDVAKGLVPKVRVVFRFIKSIYDTMNLGPENAIMCLAYIERILTLSNLTLYYRNWRRLTLASLMLASKVWEDLAVWNVDFIDVLPNLTVRDLNQLEKAMLKALGFNVSLSRSLYAKYYFELRDLEDPNKFPLQPMNARSAERLESRSNQRELEAKNVQKTRSLTSLATLSILDQMKKNPLSGGVGRKVLN